ncbi:hypothetical protein QAD02_010039 [Eretmocerus hayati]|uniref:Uncharacterized protein n=1 Tax=Eretmocerus hayati TaxID=131215 RepID=A0ACC2NBC7_9HYME|nr:hypothetical protein QAD02_010039 [Eretmocerus hayati]
MAPNVVDTSRNQPTLVEQGVENEFDSKEEEIRKRVVSTKSQNQSEVNEPISPWYSRLEDIKWFNVIFITILHIAAVYAFFTLPYIRCWRTFIWTYIIGFLGGFGITGGVHRLWSHKAYKANTAMRIFLAFCYSCAGLNSLHEWIKDHRVHHKYSETDADPHNSTRGFFFSHCGWLMQKKHPEVIRKGKQIDFSDIEADEVITFFEKYFGIMRVMFSYVIPIVVPVYFWNEEWKYAILFQVFRYVLVLNSVWSTNSVAHMFGNKPYDQSIAPVENFIVAVFALGEGWHNYHHTFPYDYRASEVGKGLINPTTHLIDLFSKIGWAYDCKVPSESLLKMTIVKRGNGTHEYSKIMRKKSGNVGKDTVTEDTKECINTSYEWCLAET